MERVFVLTGAIFAGLAIAAGAFAAHALQAQLPEKALAAFETAARYQMYHALALVLLGILVGQNPAARLLPVAGYAFIVGILLFSGSLYALSLTGIKGLGAITPLGGVAFLAGWLCLAVGVARSGRLEDT